MRLKGCTNDTVSPCFVGLTPTVLLPTLVPSWAIRKLLSRHSGTAEQASECAEDGAGWSASISIGTLDYVVTSQNESARVRDHLLCPLIGNLSARCGWPLLGRQRPTVAGCSLTNPMSQGTPFSSGRLAEGYRSSVRRLSPANS